MAVVEGDKDERCDEDVEFVVAVVEDERDVEERLGEDNAMRGGLRGGTRGGIFTSSTTTTSFFY